MNLDYDDHPNQNSNLNLNFQSDQNFISNNNNLIRSHLNNSNPLNLNNNQHIFSNEQQLLTALQKIWSNEKFSKELLKYEHDCLSHIINLIEKKEKELLESNSNKNKSGNYNNTDSSIFGDILELDIERVKYLVKDYLRVRLSKIDKYIYYIIKNDLASLLSETEWEFAVSLFKIKKNYFNEELFKKIPDTLNNFKNEQQLEEMIVAPNLDFYVCAKSMTYETMLVNLSEVWDESNESITLGKEDIYCLPYSTIK